MNPAWIGQLPDWSMRDLICSIRHDMKINKVYSAYFSATYSTKRVVNGIAGRLGIVQSEIDITNKVPEHEMVLDGNSLLVVGVPVYGGRIPASSVPGLKAIKGNGTPAVLVNVYGNRDYDDALVELYDMMKDNGFIPVAASAVIAGHCIFPKVASGRPDAEDWAKINAFCEDVKKALAEYRPGEEAALPLKGNRPYKKHGGVPIHPSAGKECNECGICAKLCPFGAIPSDNPRRTDTGRCVSCCRCISVCPQNARKFHGILAKIAGWKFTKDNSARKEPEFIVIPG